MARRAKRSLKDYPKVIAFDENLEGAADIIEAAQISVPEIWRAVKGATDHELAVTLNELIIFFTSPQYLPKAPSHRALQPTPQVTDITMP